MCALQAAFQPSDLLCPMEYCWVPYERVRATVLASSVYTGLSAVVPEAIAGLDAAHCVDNIGQPASSALQVAGLGCLIVCCSSTPALPVRLQLFSVTIGQQGCALVHMAGGRQCGAADAGAADERVRGAAGGSPGTAAAAAPGF